MRLLAILISIILFASCKHENSHVTLNFKRVASDSVLSKQLLVTTDALNLGSINKGVDSFELRVWYGIAMMQPKQLLILKYSDSSWHLTRTDYWIRFQNNYPESDLLILDSAFTKTVSTKLPFPEIVDSIKSFGLDRFTSQMSIPGFVDHVADGDSYTIEISTRDFYRAISYNNPKSYNDPLNQKMSKIILFLNKIGVDQVE